MLQEIYSLSQKIYWLYAVIFTKKKKEEIKDIICIIRKKLFF